MGHRVGEKNHQVRAAEFVAQTAGGLGEHLRLAAVALAEVFVAALHTFVAAKNYNAHLSLLSLR